MDLKCFKRTLKKIILIVFQAKNFAISHELHKELCKCYLLHFFRYKISLTYNIIESYIITAHLTSHNKWQIMSLLISIYYGKTEKPIYRHRDVPKLVAIKIKLLFN